MPINSINNRPVAPFSPSHRDSLSTHPVNGPVLKNLKTVESSTLTISTQAEMDKVSAMMREGMQTIAAAIKSDEEFKDKIPVYIDNGHKIRLAAGAVERFFQHRPNETEMSSIESRDLFRMALASQLTMHEELDNALPKNIDAELRSKILNNLFSEQFPLQENSSSEE